MKFSKRNARGLLRNVYIQALPLIPSPLLEKIVVLRDKKWSQFVSFFLLEAMFLRGETLRAELLLNRWAENFLKNSAPLFIDEKADRISARSVLPRKITFEIVLKRFYTTVVPLGVRPFLVFGTLLGFVRTGGFVPWDKDIDLGFFSEETDAGELKSVLKNAGFKILVDSHRQPPYKMKFQLGDSPMIELVFFRLEGNHRVTYGNLMGQVIKRKRKGFDLRKTKFLQTIVYIPENPEGFLTENYGKWQEPQPIYNHIFHSELTDFGNPLVQFFAKRYLCLQILKGNSTKTAHYLDLFENKYPLDPFWGKIRKKLDPLFV